MPKFGQNTISSRLFADVASSDLSYASMFGYDAGGTMRFASTAPAMQPMPTAGAFGTATSTTAMPADGVGDTITPFFDTENQPASLGTDNVPDSITGGNPTVTVGGEHVVSTINHIADQDFYAVQLVAGVKYNIGLYAAVGGPSGVPLPDAYIELYDANGNLVDFIDGEGRTPSGETYGLDAMLTITVATTGTYYINARSFDNNAEDGSDNGDTIGDYELFVELNTDPPAPPDTHYYAPDSPLRAIDWGTQVNKVHQSVRNPDGDEGPRNTGNPHGNTNYSDATDLQALATAQGKDITGKNVITVYFAKAGEVYIDDDPTTPGTTDSMVAQGFEPWEIAAYKYAFAAYEKVADIVYLVVENAYDVVSHTANADFTFLTYAGTAGPGLSLLGRMSPPDTDNEGQSEFNSNDERWTQTGLAPGGFSFTTLIHEMGHGHGLAHPHDNGGSSSVMRGVKPAGIQKDPAPTIPDPVGVWPNYTRGDYSLNQSVFTMMSYQDGWEESPYGQAASTDPFGWLKGLMAFDIAAIQDKYGANESTATGDNVYILEDANHGTLFDSNNNILAFASGFESIWDAGGTDEIRYVGTRDTNIDLRSASLKYEYGGGGWISYAVGIYGGFTIASGVTIENATSGGGNDKLIGNSANNRLDGGGGNDFLNLSAGGNDTALGGGGNDSVYFGSSFTAADSADGGAGRDVLILQGNYTLTFGAASATGFESISLQSGANTRWGDTANNYYDYNITLNDANVAAGQQLIVNGQSLRSGEDLTFDGSAETDGSFLVYGGNGVDILKGGAGNDVFYFEGQRWTSGDKVDGGGGRDAVIISAGNGVTHIEFGPTSLLNIESISLNNRYATDPSQKPSYEIVLNNGNVTPGGTLIVNGSSLATATQFVSIDGSGVHDGNLILFGGAGNDTLRGGDGADSLYGGGGKDNLTGGAGADTFQYRSAGDSTGANADNVLDFQSGADKLDLHLIDANSTADGDQAFQWIGSNAFGGTGAASAGELRVYAQSGTWIVEGDTNGDGTADFSIAVTTQGNAPLVQTDFLL